MVGLAAQHHAVEGLKVHLALFEGLDPAIEHELQIREIALELRRHLVAQRRHLAVLLGRQPLENGDACMHGEAAATGLGHRADEVAQLGIAVAAIDADAVLDRHRNGHRIQHRLHAVSHQRRMPHQAGADHVVLHPVAGAADVEVHLVVTGFLGHPRTGRQLRRHAAAELQGQRMLGWVVAEIALPVAMQQRAGGDHLGIEQRVLREQTQEIAAVPVGPIHHRRHGEAARRLGARSFCV
ncbi:hypothetical protein D3C81_1472140 [compost metagenome]